MHGLIAMNEEGLWIVLNENAKSSWKELASSVRF